MENAAVDLSGNDKDPFYPFDGGTWQGTFQSVVTTGLTELGITAQIYYNASRNAPVPSGGQKPEEVLTAANGWYPAETFLQSHNAADVQAVAVDLGSYTLDPLEGVSFQIRMQAPEDVPEDQNYAYNNASFYSVQENTGVDTEAYVEGNSARVSLGREEILEVSKEFAGEIPSAVQENTFEIHLYEEVNGTIPFANKEYQLWKLENGEWVQETSRLYATDGSGILSLKAGEKAVFPSAGRGTDRDRRGRESVLGAGSDGYGNRRKRKDRAEGHDRQYLPPGAVRTENNRGCAGGHRCERRGLYLPVVCKER